MKIGSTQILTKTVSSGTNTIVFSDTELDSIYKLYSSSKTLTATFILTTASTYTNSKTCTITLTGNQKTGRIGINNISKRAKMYIGINGVPKKCVLFIGVDNKPKALI